MNIEEMYSSINKGIPNQIKLELPIEDLVNYCAENKSKLLGDMLKIRNKFENAIVSICGYNKSNHEFFNNLRLITNYKDSNTQIYVSPVCFISRLKEILGVTNESLDLDDEELKNEFNNRLNILNSIDDIDDLKEKFPAIFEDYKYSLNLKDRIFEESKNSPEKADFMRLNFQKNGLDTRFKVFLSNQKMMYASFLEHAKEIEEFANRNKIDLEYFDGLDKEKFELYVANKYLEYAKKTDEDKLKQRAIYYLTTYLNEECGHVVSMPYMGKTLTNISLLKDFRNFLNKNRELKPINEPREVFDSYHIKHVKNHISKYHNGLDNWCMLRITPEQILNNQKIRLENLTAYNLQNPDVKTHDKEHLISEKYMAMLIRKLFFYENSGYELRLFGVGPFESRVAYFYPNGIVAVDKLYEESLDINPTYNEAIYVMDINTFINMITMDKPALRENDNVKRIFHSGHWEERLKKEIDNPSINLNVDDVKVLTKKYKNGKKDLSK